MHLPKWASSGRGLIMDSGSIAGMGGVMTVLVLLGVVLLIAWILLPFAMFGIKPLLRDLLAATKETNRLLAAQAPPKAPVVPEKPLFGIGRTN
jgi:hypothetical protein